ncbi:MAG: hypothetical protein V1661_02855 [bacterium]
MSSHDIKNSNLNSQTANPAGMGLPAEFSGATNPNGFSAVQEAGDPVSDYVNFTPFKPSSASP